MKAYIAVLGLAAVMAGCGENGGSAESPLEPHRSAVTVGPATSVSGDSATISTDRDDYAPGDTVTFTGAGFKAGEAVEITLHEDPFTHDDRVLYDTADASGNFINRDFVPELHHLNVRFLVTATGSEGSWAETTFTDGARIQSVAALGVQTPNPLTAGNTASYGTAATNSLRVAFNTSLLGTCTVSLSATGLPAGATAGFSPSVLTGTAGQSVWSFLTVTTSSITPGGTIVFTARATGTGGAGNACSGTDTETAFASLSVVANLGTVVSLAVPSPASISFGSAGPVTLSAILTRGLAGPSVAGATITFTVDGATVGSAVTNTSGVATLSTYDPSALTAGSHSVRSTFAGGIVGGVTLAASTSGPQALSVGKATPSINWSPPADITYGTPLSGTQLNASASAAGTFTYTPAAGVVLNAGNGQALHVVFTPADATNLNSAFRDVGINVLRKGLEIRADSRTKVYGDLVSFTGTEFSAAGLVTGDVVNGVTLTSAGAAPTAPVAPSPYAIVPASALGTGLSNYVVTYANGQLTVTPAPLSVTADSKTKVEGGTNPPLTGSLTGVRNGDAITASYSTTAQTLSPPGSYPIVPALVDPGARLGNYAVSSGNGTLIITPNAAPVLGAVTAPTVPVPVGSAVTASAAFTDADVAESAPYTATIDWGDGTVATLAYAAPGTIKAQHAYTAAGLYAVGIAVRQDNIPTKQDSRSYQYVVVYDQGAGFTTGGGWIDSPPGASTTSSAGKVTFGFVVRYENGRSTPTGNMELQLHEAGIDFKGTSFDWLVIDGTRASFEGSGAINGRTGYAFVVTAIDGGRETSAFRIRMWEKASGAVFYDTQLGALATAVPTTPLKGGSIQIKRK